MVSHCLSPSLLQSVYMLRDWKQALYRVLSLQAWSSPRITSDLQTTEIYYPEENGGFREWTLI